jgi:hypothetical protein
LGFPCRGKPIALSFIKRISAGADYRIAGKVRYQW